MEPPRFRFIDLFAGVGGFHHAMSSLGGECAMACELDPECRRVYQAAFPELPAHRFPSDVRTLTTDADGQPLPPAEIDRRVPDHDVLCAGFPCQPFSKSGAQLGVRDRTRGTLFFDIMEIARAKQPRYMILENVRNLAGPRHKDTWATILESIRSAGYRVCDEPVVLSPHLVPSHRGGAPQVRDRVFIMCEWIGEEAGPALIGPPLLHRLQFRRVWNPDKWRIADILAPDESITNVDKYRLSPRALTWVEAWDALVREIPTDNLPGFPIWADCLVPEPDVPSGTPHWKESHLRKNSAFYLEHRDFLDDWLTRRWGPDQLTVLQFPPSRFKLEWQARRHYPTRHNRTLEGLVLQMRPSGIRVKPPSYLPALVAITQTSIVGPQVAAGIETYRELTPAEAATLQGIPYHAFHDAGVPDRAIYKQLGNAVNVGVVRLVAQTLMDTEHSRPPELDLPMALFTTSA